VRTVFELRVERGRAANLPSPFGRGAGGEGVAEIEDRARVEGRAGGANFIAIDVEADGFLYNMVRAIVGTLVQVGRGERPEHWPGEVLRAADRGAAGPTAPPQGLCLLNVKYATREERGEGEDSATAGPA
jgi:tRNA pseudouridine38-40 synthase